MLETLPMWSNVQPQLQPHLPRYGFCIDELYHRSRTHLALAKDAPEPRAILQEGEIAAIPQVGACIIATNAVPHDENDMVTLNRSAIVVTPKRPFLDWLHGTDPTRVVNVRCSN